MNQFDIPLLLIVFNRPKETKQVFNKIRMIKPKKLYIVADGPRTNINCEIELVEKTREIFKKIDWDCTVKTNYQDKNLGCGLTVSQGITWFFENEEMGIILEDDCVPSISFFKFAKEMLQRYIDDTRIMHISGSRYNEERKRNDDSYFFSKYAHISGWATWRRAWQLFDFNMSDWKLCKEQNWIYDMYPNKNERNYWFNKYERIYEAENKHAWGFQWQYCVRKNNSLCITPAKNLIYNIGVKGTHVKGIIDNPHLFSSIDENFNVNTHPVFFIHNKWFDDYHFKNHIKRKKTISKRILKKFKKFLTNN